jgi:hypothetical protein
MSTYADIIWPCTTRQARNKKYSPDALTPPSFCYFPSLSLGTGISAFSLPHGITETCNLIMHRWRHAQCKHFTSYAATVLFIHTQFTFQLWTLVHQNVRSFATLLHLTISLTWRSFFYFLSKTETLACVNICEVQSSRQVNAEKYVTLSWLYFVLFLCSHVLNYDFPRNIEEYVHRIGRTGRAG